MTNEGLIRAVIVKPEIKRLSLPVESGGLGLSVADLEAELFAFVPSVVTEVSSLYEWDFAIKETTHSGGTVANTAEYTFEGADKDCLNVSSIRYGSDETLLEKKTIVAIDKLENRSTPSSPSYWAPSGRDSFWPKVLIVATPTESGKALLYRYWRRDVELAEFSPVFDYLLEVALAKRMSPVYGGAIYSAAVAQTIGMYDRGAGDIDVTEPDPAVLAGNHRRYNMNGRG